MLDDDAASVDQYITADKMDDVPIYNQQILDQNEFALMHHNLSVNAETKKSMYTLYLHTLFGIIGASVTIT